jgi:hypothetical protein
MVTFVVDSVFAVVGAVFSPEPTIEEEVLIN